MCFLTKKSYFCSNIGNNAIYVTTAEHSPNIMREIGRLREISFATEGGGTGKEWTSTNSTPPQSHACPDIQT